MNRRDFCNNLALISAGAAALPSQIAAFETLYDVNSRHLGDLASDFIKVDGITIGGIATRSEVLITEFFDDQDFLLSMPMNAFGGIFHWVSHPTMALITTMERFRWTTNVGPWLAPEIATGSLHYVDADLRSRGVRMDFHKGQL